MFVSKVKDLSYHCNYLGLHLAHTRKHVWVNGVCHCELAKRLRLQSDQLVTTVVDSTADSSIFPLGMLHVGKIVQLLAHIFFAPSFTG